MSKLREIVFDTETTGIDPLKGDRIVEFGALELVNHIPTGRSLHLYINPERDVPAEVVAVHGLTTEFLADKPIFAEVVDEILTFIEDSTLVAHNANFDMMFLNAECARLGFPRIDKKRVVDTLAIARQKFPGAPASLDALCKRFNIDNSGRTLHGALLDSELLADVYLELLGGRQTAFELGLSLGGNSQTAAENDDQKTTRPVRNFAVPAAELEAHAKSLEKVKNALWQKFIGTTAS